MQQLPCHTDFKVNGIISYEVRSATWCNKKRTKSYPALISSAALAQQHISAAAAFVHTRYASIVDTKYHMEYSNTKQRDTQLRLSRLAA